MSKVDLNLAFANDVLRTVYEYNQEIESKSFFQRFTFLQTSDFGIANLSECLKFLEMLRQANFVSNFKFKIIFMPNILFFKKLGSTSKYLYLLFK